jgi:uncharacterized membrane protein
MNDMMDGNYWGGYGIWFIPVIIIVVVVVIFFRPKSKK